MMLTLFARWLLGVMLAFGAIVPAAAQNPPLGPGERLIPITTPQGKYKVWVKRVGSNPKIKLLLLHGGPGATHELLENFGPMLRPYGIEVYYYDQLGSGRSDHPDNDALWTTERFVEEVEQVRKALGLGPRDFCLYGQSWGGLLAIEYALKYQKNLKCLVISNMMASVPAYNAYARDVLMPAMDQKLLAEVKALEASGKTDDPRYMQILMPMHYEKHILRRPAAQWPEPITRTFSHLNAHLYTLMQGPSELGASGRLEHWDRFDDLARITVPTLVIGARYDSMDPVYMARMAVRLPRGDFLYMPESGHLAMWDEPRRYFTGLAAFLGRVR
jgi:proline iminopeptidase